ncbi:MAG TPA: galactose oxidase-like domain-containing protein [Actinomycetota bacterium]|nr:galactose oxidase-like domain-containing protein [Actinomycetota bacterium]
MRTKRLRVTTTLLALATLGSILSGAMTTARAATPSCAAQGCWTAPFSPFHKFDNAPPQTVAESELYPAAASQVMLPDGQVLYWNGLQNIEGCGQLPVPANAGACLGNAKSEILDLRASAPLTPAFMPVAVPAGNHDDLFCSDQRLLENGTVLDTGGTYWATEEPKGGTGIAGADGLGELYGSKNTRVFNPSTGQWTTYTSAMHTGRWYPTMLTLPSGDEFVAGGVTKLLWNSSIMTQIEDAIGNTQYEQATFPLPENVQTTETWSLAHGGWSQNPAKDNVELPLFGRLHLLPDGEIFFSSNGQQWGPAGESINELNWNNMMLFDPSQIGKSTDQGWRKVGMFPLGATSGAAEVMMPLDASTPTGLNTVHILVAGGALGVAPDTYLAQSMSQMITLTKSSSGWNESSAMTGNLNNRRWFSSSVLLPNGQVVVFSGADKDEVILPGSEVPVHQAELFDPATNKWTALSSSVRDRTYHNSAILLPDGSILVGGHAPINQGYGGTGNALPLDTLGFAHNLKDPSFERFFPPYLYAGPRPELNASQAHATWGGTLHAEIAPGSAAIDHFVLTRLPAQTHITDADARTVILGAGQRSGNSVSLNIPNNRAALTPGFYYLFAISPKGVPSVATIVQIADPHYYTGASSATPVDLATQAYRSSSTGTVSAVSLPATSSRAAKHTATSPASTDAKLATDAAVPASKPVAPARSSQGWLIVVAALMGAVLTKRIWSLARR